MLLDKMVVKYFSFTELCSRVKHEQDGGKILLKLLLSLSVCFSVQIGWLYANFWEFQESTLCACHEKVGFAAIQNLKGVYSSFSPTLAAWPMQQKDCYKVRCKQCVEIAVVSLCTVFPSESHGYYFLLQNCQSHRWAKPAGKALSF